MRGPRCVTEACYGIQQFRHVEAGSHTLSLDQIREMLSHSFQLSETWLHLLCLKAGSCNSTLIAKDVRVEQLRVFFGHVVRLYHPVDGGAGFIEFLHIMRILASYR